MQLSPTKNLVLKLPWKRHIHDGVSKAGKLLGTLGTLGTTILVPIAPKIALPFGIITFTGFAFSQCVDILIPCDNSQNDNIQGTIVDTTNRESL
jgi:hypothetical protein